MRIEQTRRRFIGSISAAGAVGLIGSTPPLADEGPPETTTIRLPHDPFICIAPLYIAGDLLRAEGFTDVRYMRPPNISVVRGEVDFDLQTAAWLSYQLDAGAPITVLAGVHPGCYELFAQESIRTISDLRGRRVGVPDVGSPGHLQLAIMAANVGLDPRVDIEWVASPGGNFMDLFAAGEVDAFLAFPPEPQELRARKIGRMILSLATEKPWSQYFCCMAVGTRAFVHKHPIATKRFLRAILKAADLCANTPDKAARQMVEDGFAPRLDYARQTLAELPYAMWREFDPEDAMRFYALRLHEVGMIRSSPQTIIAEGTDWRFLSEIKREMKV